MEFQSEIIKILAKHTELKKAEIVNLISIPPDPKLGDYAFPCFKLGKNPKEAADKLQKKIKLPQFLEKIATAGPYLNFYLNKTVLAEETLNRITTKKEKYGNSEIGKGKKIILEYSAPNIAKPFGIGHLRSTILGHCLNNTYKKLGYETISINHLGDWGTQFGKLIVAYNKWGDEKELKKNPIKYLLKLYVKFHDEAEKDDSLNDEGRAEFKKLEEGDKKTTKLWKQFKKLSLVEFDKVYDILGVKFDSNLGEAFYANQLPATVEYVKKKTETEMSKGALIVDLEKYKMPPILLIKSNGSTSYHTRDIAAALYRLKEYHPDKILYFVGSDHKLHFEQLFKTLELIGEDKNKFEHVDFGMIRFPEGKMSTRKGRVIFLEDVLDKAISLAEKIIEEKNPDLKNKKEIAKQIGIGAIIFGDLSNDRVRNINFDWDKILSFEGETAPYIQYTHARACSVLRKANYKKKVIDFKLLIAPEELAIIKLLYYYQNVLERVCKDNKPHHLANYLIALAQTFNEFYHKCQIISENEKQMQARLLLTTCTKQVIKNGLGLLGIEAPEEM